MKNSSSVWIFILLLVVASSVQAADELKWQTSWAAFVAILGPELGPNPMNPAYKQFEGKAVKWEGTLGAIGAAEDTRIRIDMNPKETQGYVVNVQLSPKAGEFARWKATPIGAKVRFRAVIDTSFPILVMTDVASGTHVAAVAVSNGELVAR